MYYFYGLTAAPQLQSLSQFLRCYVTNFTTNFAETTGSATGICASSVSGQEKR